MIHEDPGIDSKTYMQLLNHIKIEILDRVQQVIEKIKILE